MKRLVERIARVMAIMGGVVLTALVLLTWRQCSGPRPEHLGAFRYAHLVFTMGLRMR